MYYRCIVATASMLNISNSLYFYIYIYNHTCKWDLAMYSVLDSYIHVRIYIVHVHHASTPIAE